MIENVCKKLNCNSRKSKVQAIDQFSYESKYKNNLYILNINYNCNLIKTKKNQCFVKYSKYTQKKINLLKNNFLLKILKNNFQETNYF